MKIISVGQYKGNTYCIEIENRDNVYVDKSIAEKYNLRKDTEIPEAALEQIVYDNTLRKAKSRAFYLLGGRDHCREELWRKLKNSYSEEICDLVCEYMQELGFLNDEEYAKKLAKKLLEIKGLGMFRAKMEMKRTGIAEEFIDEALEPYADDESSLERLEKLVEKKYERYLTDEKGVRKVKSALARAGYSYDEINAVLDMYDLDFDGSNSY